MSAVESTTLCRCWILTRADGLRMGFTDHDAEVSVDGVACRPEAGFAAREVMQGTGLAVDNSEAVGVFASDRITEADLDAGRYDGAEVALWEVDWTAPALRHLRFRGSLGDVRRGQGQFEVELRGLSEALNQPRGRTFQAGCGARFGDAACGFDRAAETHGAEVPVGRVVSPHVLEFKGVPDFEDRWFERGTLEVLSGAAEGLSGTIKRDRPEGGLRQVTLWSPLRAALAEGDMVRLIPGCDKRAETCRLKFDNLANFRGFPDIPGEDWLMSLPVQAADADGGPRR